MDPEYIQGELSRQWTSFLRMPFPSSAANRTVQNICLISLDIFTSGCVSHFFKANGKLDAENKKILEDYCQKIETVLPEIDKEAHEYFQTLKTLADKVLSEASS